MEAAALQGWMVTHEGGSTDGLTDHWLPDRGPGGGFSRSFILEIQALARSSSLSMDFETR